MGKRILNRKGLTLAEMLVTVAILVVFVSLAAVGMTGLFGAGDQMASASKAAALGADALNIVADEVRFGDHFAGGGASVQYDSAYYGAGCTLTAENGRLVVIKNGKSSGGAEASSETKQTYYPLSDASYGEVAIGSVSFTLGSEGEIAVSLEVTDARGNVLWQNQTAVIPLSAKLAA